MPPLIHPRLNRKRVISRLLEECLYSLVVWCALLLDCCRSDRILPLFGAWVALTIMTVFGSYVGQLVKRECKDLNYVWLSLNQKIPDWELWTFWPTAIAVWINPVFAPTAYVVTALATWRGFWFHRRCMGYRAATLLDVLIRFTAGLAVACI